VDYEAASGGSVSLMTDLPGEGSLSARELKSLPVALSRRVYQARLSGTTKGRLWKVTVSSTGGMSLFGVRAYVRTVGRKASEWQWMQLPVTPTSDANIEFRLPITPTSDEYMQFALPITPTSDEYLNLKLPIEPSPQQERWIELAPDA
jgi:hypothetical protein